MDETTPPEPRKMTRSEIIPLAIVLALVAAGIIYTGYRMAPSIVG